MPQRPQTHRPYPRSTVRPPDTARPSAAKRGYGRRWQRYRLAFLAANPVCQYADPVDGTMCCEPAVDVDHVRAVTGPDDPRFWDAGNHQGLCHRHHSAKTAREKGVGR